MEALRKLYSNNCIPIINLTNRLREVAGQLVLKNEYVFWRDDTHYNNIGIDIIANLIKYYLDDYYIKYNKNRCELKKFVMEDQIFK